MEQYKKRRREKESPKVNESATVRRKERRVWGREKKGERRIWSTETRKGNPERVTFFGQNPIATSGEWISREKYLGTFVVGTCG